MSDRLLATGTLTAVLGSGLIAGTFFAFSSFVMPALARLPAAQGIASMQSINVVVINPLFLGVFVGTAGVSLALKAKNRLPCCPLLMPVRMLTQNTCRTA